MRFYAALDVSLEKTAVCVMGRDGSIVRELEVATCPEALACCLVKIAPAFELVGLEAGPMSEWLVRGLAKRGVAAVLIETRQVRAALSSMRTKSDRNDARGMAHLLRIGWFRPVHIKATDTREHRTRLAARDALVRRVRDLENSMRGLLRAYGLRVPLKTRGGWDHAIRGLIEGHLGLTGIFEPLLLARAALHEQLAVLDKQVRETARTDPICKRLMTAPGVGAIVALTLRCAVDDPRRFTSSRSIGAFFGLTPRRYQSGETDRVGGISRAGDPAARAALFEAAHVIMTRVAKWSALKSWAVRVAQRRGAKRGKVALARKLAVVLHRMWVSETDFRYAATKEA